MKEIIKIEIMYQEILCVCCIPSCMYMYTVDSLMFATIYIHDLGMSDVRGVLIW